MTPYQKFQTIFEKWFRFTSASIGLNILDKNFKITPHTISTITIITSFLLCAIYTTFAFDSETSFKGASCMSLAIQGVVKTYTVLSERSTILFLTSFLEKIYAVNVKKPSREIQCTMQEYSSHVLNITGILFGLYSLCGVGFLLYPVLVFTIFSSKEVWLPVYIPFVDINTRDGYIITSCYHYVILYMATVGLGFCDGLFFNLVFNVLTMSELQCNQQKKLNEELETPKFPATAIKTRLVNFFKMNQEMEKYIKIINETYFSMIFSQILTTSLTTVLVIFIIMTMTWYPAYLLAMCLVFQLFLFCALGTIVDIANDRLNHAILQTNFHLLPIKLQKDFKFMVKIVQQAQYLKVGGPAKLDVATFVLIMRKIYTFIVLLQTMI